MSQPGPPSNFSPQRQPFLYLTAALVAGILVDRYIEPPRMIVAVLTLVCVAASVKLVLAKRAAAGPISSVQRQVSEELVLGISQEAEGISLRDAAPRQKKAPSIVD